MRLSPLMLVLAACASTRPQPATPPPPPKVATLASQAPADTRVLFRFEGKEAMFGNLEPIAEACDTSFAHDVTRIEGWATEKGELHVAIEGAIGTGAVTCMMHALGAGDLGPVRMRAREGGGVLLETKGAAAGKGAPEALAARFSADGADAIVAVLGRGGVTDATLKSDGKRVELAVHPGPSRVAALAKAFAPAKEKIPGFEVASSKDAVTLRFEPRVDLATTLRREVVESFRMPSGSMIPSLAVGDHFFVLKDAAGTIPARGEVIVYADERGNKFVKRVIGVPGDRVQTNDDALVVRKKLRPFVLPSMGPDEPEQRGAVYEEKLGDRRYEILLTEGMAGATTDHVVPDGHVYVMGDNRFNSHDSRFTGPVPKARVLGRAAIVYWPGDGGWDRVLSPVE